MLVAAWSLLIAAPANAQQPIPPGGPPPGVDCRDAVDLLADRLSALAARYGKTADQLAVLLVENSSL